MRRGDYIVTYEDAQGQEKADGSVVSYPYELFMAGHLGSKGHGPPPPMLQVQGAVRAYINHGRWVVDCPEGCGGAAMASLKYRVFICPNCGSPGNSGQWYHVIFPGNFRQIETVLLKRPNKRGVMVPDDAENRNWRTGETLATLERENIEHGVV